LSGYNAHTLLTALNIDPPTSGSSLSAVLSPQIADDKQRQARSEEDEERHEDLVTQVSPPPAQLQRPV
jgi:hypothetical protein